MVTESTPKLSFQNIIENITSSGDAITTPRLDDRSEWESGKCHDIWYHDDGYHGGDVMWSAFAVMKDMHQEKIYFIDIWIQLDLGLILGLHPANERRRYKVTTSLIGWAQT